jgi:hypothetical protein
MENRIYVKPNKLRSSACYPVLTAHGENTRPIKPAQRATVIQIRKESVPDQRILARIEFPTTESELNAMAPAAMIG